MLYCDCLRGLEGLFTILNVCLHDVQDVLKSIFASAFTFYNTGLWYSQFSHFLPQLYSVLS